MPIWSAIARAFARVFEYESDPENDEFRYGLTPDELAATQRQAESERKSRCNAGNKFMAGDPL